MQHLTNEFEMMQKEMKQLKDKFKSSVMLSHYIEIRKNHIRAQAECMKKITRVADKKYGTNFSEEVEKAISIIRRKSRSSYIPFIKIKTEPLDENRFQSHVHNL